MKFILTLLCSLLILVSTISSAAAENRWLPVGSDASNKTSWYVDSKTLTVNDNKTTSFWAKVILNNPKYDIVEIKLKYLLSADKLQLTKLQEIGYNDKKEILWNNNVTKTISVIPGSGHEKLIIFIDDFLKEKERLKKNTEDKQKSEPAAQKNQQTIEEKNTADSNANPEKAVTDAASENDAEQKDQKQ